jgi:hypothetical protein
MSFVYINIMEIGIEIYIEFNRLLFVNILVFSRLFRINIWVWYEIGRQFEILPIIEIIIYFISILSPIIFYFYNFEIEYYMVNKFIYFIGIFLCSISLTLVIIYFNLIKFGYSFFVYIEILLKTWEFYLFIFGIFLIKKR